MGQVDSCGMQQSMFARVCATCTILSFATVQLDEGGSTQVVCNIPRLTVLGVVLAYVRAHVDSFQLLLASQRPAVVAVPPVDALGVQHFYQETFRREYYCVQYVLKL